eukprot:scaffold127708_cov54-Phaeocystis_antarctica.AAC.1
MKVVEQVESIAAVVPALQTREYNHARAHAHTVHMHVGVGAPKCDARVCSVGRLRLTLSVRLIDG